MCDHFLCVNSLYNRKREEEEERTRIPTKQLMPYSCECAVVVSVPLALGYILVIDGIEESGLSLSLT